MKAIVRRSPPASLAMNASLVLAASLAASVVLAQSTSAPPASPSPIPSTNLALPPAILPGPSRPFTSPRLLLNNPNREALEAPLRSPDLNPSKPPQGPLLRQLRSEFSLRSALESINPLAPIPPELKKLRYAHELNRPIDHGYPRSLRDPLTPSVPRAFQDPLTHEPSLRLW